MPTPLRQCFLSILFLGTGTLILLQTLPYLSYRPPQRAPPHATFAPPRPPRLVAIHFGAPRVLAKGGPEAVLQAVYYPPALATAHSPYATPPPSSGAEPEVRSFVIFAPGVRGGMGPGEGAEALKAGKRGRRDDIWAATADDAASSYAGGQAGRPGGDNHDTGQGDNHDTGNNQGLGSGNHHGRGGNNHNNNKQPPLPSRRHAADAFVFVRAATELQRRGVGSLHLQWRTTPLEGGSLRDARQDVRRAVAWLRRQSFGARVQVVLVGHSFGGAVVWSAGAHASELGVVGAATFATAVRGSAPKGGKDDVLDRAAAARGLAAAALLVVHGEGDLNLHYQWSQKMFDAANAVVGGEAEAEAGGRAGAGVATRPGAGATDGAGANVAGGSGSGGAGPRATRPARSLVLVEGGTHNFGKSTACLSELLVEWVSSVCGVPVPWRPPRRRDRSRRQYLVRGGERRGAGSDGGGSGARAVQETYYSLGGCGDGVPRVARGAAQHKTAVLRVLGDLHVIDKPS